MLKNNMFMMTINIYLEIVELAQKHGKKPGDSMQEELEEVMMKHKDEVKFLGQTDQDIDMVVGNMRESGIKVLNLKEIERRKKNEQENL